MDRKPETISNEIERRNVDKEKVLHQIALMQEATDERISEIRRKGEEIRLQIQKTLEDLDQSIHRSISNANSIFDRHKSDLMTIVDRIETENRKDKAYLVIGRFPVEILGYIFEECVERDTSPWTLAKTCRFWKDTAMCTPSLWSTISVVNSITEYIRIREIPPTAVENPRSFRREQVCVSLQELKAATERAGNGPLSIQLLFGRNSNWHHQSVLDFVTANTSANEELLLREKPIYEFLFKEPINSRIKTLEWRSEGMRNFKTIADAFEGPLPMLTTLIMSNAAQTSYAEPIVNLVVQHAPSLRHIEFSAPTIPAGMGPEFWGKMETVHVSMTTNVDQLFSGKADVEALTGLRHELYGNAWPTASTVRTTFDRLAELDVIVRCVSYLSKIELPALKRLDILVRIPRENMQQPSPEFSLQLPMLKSLTIRALGCRPIRHFVMPNLQSLTIISEAVTKNSCEEDLTSISNSGLLNSITHFDLSAQLTDKGLVTVFASLKAAETIRLTPGKRLGYALFKHIIPSRRDIKNANILCPHLRHFYIDLYENNTKVSESFGLNMRDLITSRSTLAVKLERMEVKQLDGIVEDFVNKAHPIIPKIKEPDIDALSPS